MKDSKQRIKQVTDRVCKMLQEKNDAYGNSALEPINVFSKGNASDSLRARIDDKLARIKNRGINDETEDTLFDLCGYLVLLILSEEQSKPNGDTIKSASGYRPWTTDTTQF